MGGPALDAGGAVADHPVELFPELADHPRHAVVRQGILVAGLGGRKYGKRVHALVADERLRELGVAINDVDEIENDPALCPHHQVEIAQAHVEIDYDNVLARPRQGRPQCGR